MLSTYLSYQLITRDINKSISRIEQQPMVDRETKYYLDNITKVKSIDDFVNDTRLFKYAMKAFGLQDMDYAKAFMVKALKEGVSDPDSFANKLTDKRYAEFVNTYNFAKLGDTATVYMKAQQQTVANYVTQAAINGTGDDTVKTETSYYLANIGKVKTIDDFVKDQRLFSYAMKAFGLGDMTYARAFMVKALKEGIAETDSFANKLTDKRYAQFVAAFNFEQYGDAATDRVAAQQGTVDKYMRQTLEEDAGKTNEGVRLALNFERKAGDITNWYDVLADRALSSVVRTVLGLPDSFATADIDKQAALFESKLDIADFTDPAKLSKFLGRFTTLYEINHPTSSAQTSVSILFAQPTTIGISTDLMIAMQNLRY